MKQIGYPGKLREQVCLFLHQTIVPHSKPQNPRWIPYVSPHDLFTWRTDGNHFIHPSSLLCHSLAYRVALKGAEFLLKDSGCYSNDLWKGTQVFHNLRPDLDKQFFPIMRYHLFLQFFFTSFISRVQSLAGLDRILLSLYPVVSISFSLPLTK